MNVRKETWIAVAIYFKFALVMLGAQMALRMLHCASINDCASKFATSVLRALIWPVVLAGKVPKPVIEVVGFLTAALALAIVFVWASGKYLPRLLPPEERDDR